MLRKMLKTYWIPFFLMALWAAPILAQTSEPGFQVTPELPTLFDPLEITATYPTNCLQEGRLERRGDTLRVVAVEGCICPLAPDVLTPVTVPSPPLPPGIYTLELVVERLNDDPSCETDPIPLFTDQLLVSASGKIRSLRTLPAEPRAGEPVTLEMQIDLGENFFLLSSIRFVDRVLQLEVNPCVLSGCPPQEVYALELGPLAPGLYTVVVVSEGNSADGVLPILEVPFAFEVTGRLSPGDRRSPRDALGLTWTKAHPTGEHPTVTVTPPHPRWSEDFELTLETFLDCPLGQRTEVVGRELRLVLERDCTCPPAIPVPITLRGTFGPLPPGLYDVVLAVQDVGTTPVGGAPCRPRPERSPLGSVLVSGSGTIHTAALTFLEPAVESGVFLDLTYSPRERGFFPQTSDDGSLPGPLLRVSEGPPSTTLTLLPLPLTEWRVPLVPLAPGDYSILHLDDGPHGLPVLEAVIPFRYALPGRN